MKQVTHSKYKRFSAFITVVATLITTACLSPLDAEIDTGLIKKVSRDSFRYFIDYTPEHSGLTRDSSRRDAPCSVAGVGFYLAALPVAAENQWLSRKDAYERALTALTTLTHKGERKNGFFYHFIDPFSGKRAWKSEASSIDTALLVAGALVAGEYFKGTNVEKLANNLYDDVDWKWMTNGTDLLCHGYTPESGFLPYYWDMYSEHLIMQALAIGSQTHPIPPSTWRAWKRDTEKVGENEIVYSYSGSLFTYQYPQSFIDFRYLDDSGINYFKNSLYATTANINFCKENQNNFKTYQEEYWGLTACVGPNGYKPYGATPGFPFHDGTVAPYGALASIPFTPTESLLFMHKLYSEYKKELYGPCGFRDAFNLDKQWFAREYLSIDQGITVIMIENYRTGLIWELFMAHPRIQEWIALCELQSRT
jgi:hypothetical protein